MMPLPKKFAGFTMRANIIAIAGLALVTTAFFLVGRSASPSAALAFSGYDTNGWAMFTLTNHTRFYLQHSHPRIQVRTPAGWTNFYGIETLMCQLMGPLPARDGATLSASLPTGAHRWRASVQYRVIPVYEPGWRTTLESMLAAIRLGARTNEITLVTKEFMR
jgi:hypothetical protein